MQGLKSKGEKKTSNDSKFSFTADNVRGIRKETPSKKTLKISHSLKQTFVVLWPPRNYSSSLRIFLQDFNLSHLLAFVCDF